MPADDATLDDLATAASVLYRLEVRRQAFAGDLPDGWRDAVAAMGEDLRLVQLAMINAHTREAGQPPPQYLSTQPARRCRFMVPGSVGGPVLVECGKPSGWRKLDPETMAARYACEDHVGDLKATGAQVEQLLR